MLEAEVQQMQSRLFNLALPHPDIEEFIQSAQLFVDLEEEYDDLAHTHHYFLQQSYPSLHSAP